MDKRLNSSLETSSWVKIWKLIIHFWVKIITIGITDDLSFWEQKRTRLLNGIATMSLIVLVIFCLFYLDPAYRLTLIESFQGVVAMALVLILNYYRKYLFACHFFLIYNALNYSFAAISHGNVDAVEYYLVIGSITSLLFFKTRKIILFYFILYAFLFAICKYSFTVMSPFLAMPNGENLFYTNHFTMFILLFLIVYYLKTENEHQENQLEIRNKLIEKEKEKSDNLLLNILPAETAEELKETGASVARSYKMVTVFFSDIKNFSVFAEKLSPEMLIKEINICFSAFDQIINKYAIEKIKTIGDAYMCAAGLPEENTHNPIDMVNAALEINNFMNVYKNEKIQKNEQYFEIRIGIHTGPVVAGIVGIKKFAYDLWGDTVNIASRMETSGEVGKVNISQATYDYVKDHFKCIHRGKIDAKNKGEIDMYFVEKI